MFYVIVILCCLFFLWRRWSMKSLSEPPTQSGWMPIVGHGYKFLGNGANNFKVLVEMSKECLEKGGVTTFQLGPRTFYGIGDPDDCQTIGSTCLNKSEFFKFAKPVLGNGLLVADVERWHTSRKLLNPAFNQKVLDGFIGIFNSQAEDLVNKFAAKTGKPFDHERLLRMNNLETICITSFDVHTCEVGDTFTDYVKLLTRALKKVNSRLQKFWLHSDFIYSMTREKKEFDEISNGLSTLSQKIIQKKRAERKNVSNTKAKGGKPKKFIDLILDVAEETGSFTDQQIGEEVDNIVLGGHDTITPTLTFALTLLGSHADVQAKVYEEITYICGNSTSIEKDDLSKLVYTEAVLKETLRLYPIGFILVRYIDKDVKLKNYTIKANNVCFLLLHSLHRNSVWGPDADQFRPERWLDKETLPDSKHYAAFGLGRRSCIGKAYGMMSMKIILAHVVRRFRVSSDIEKMVISIKMTPRPKSGYFISLEPRQ